jgi:hypothetical protein
MTTDKDKLSNAGRIDSMNRRDFLKLIGIGSAVAAVPELIAEPVRRIWQVSSNAPVGSRIERVSYADPIWLAGEYGFTFSFGSPVQRDEGMHFERPRILAIDQKRKIITIG